MNAQIAGSTPRSGPAPRRYELDWLRTLIVLGIIPYHALVIFGASSAISLKSAQSTPAFAVLGGFVLTWGIPSIFLMAGAATRLALERRAPSAYIRERFGRLLVPMVLVAVIFSPVQAYFILLSNPSLVSLSPVPIQHPEQLGDFRTFYGTYLTLLVSTVRAYSPRIGTLVLAHVWFIPRLLVVSLLTVLLVVCLRRAGQRVRAHATHLDQRPVLMLFGGGLATAVVVALLGPGWLEHFTIHWLFTDVWSDFVLDLALFLCGYLIYARPRLSEAVCSRRIFTLLLGLSCWTMVAGVALVYRAPSASFAPASLLYSGTQALSAWLLSLALLGFAMRYFTFTTRQQRYLSDATFPVYLVHMPILTIAAYYVLKLPLPWYLQVLLIIAATFVLAFGIFEFVLRRTPVTRFLFGVRGQGLHDDPHTVPAASTGRAARGEDAPTHTPSPPTEVPPDEEMSCISETKLAQLFRQDAHVREWIVRTASHAETPL